MRVLRLQRLDHVLDVDLEAGGDLAGSRRPPQRVRQDGHRAPHRRLEILQPPWHPHRPGAVPEVPLDLSGDGGDGVAQERAHVVLETGHRDETLHRVEQTDAAGLLHVLGRLAPAAVAARDVAHDRQERGDQLPTQLPAGRIIRCERRIAHE